MTASPPGPSLDFDAIVALCQKIIAAETGTLFIEGVGGVMVPLDERRTVLDWMEALELPLIMVAGSYLGTISHTLTALDVVARRGLTVKALVLNETGDGAVPIEETQAALARFHPALTIATIPRVKHPLDAEANFAALWRAIG